MNEDLRQLAIQAIANQLSCPHEAVRHKAAESLAQIGDETVIEPLCQALEIEKNFHAAYMIIHAIGEIFSRS